MDEIGKYEEFLREWRYALPGHHVSTFWSPDHNSWICSHRLRDGTEIDEMLEAPAKDPEAALLAELRSVNICAPLIASSISQCNGSPRVFPLDDGHWAAWIPCSRCGGFPWRLQVICGTFGSSDSGEALERELARMLAHRAVFLHGSRRLAEECIGCLDQDLRSPDFDADGEQFPWYSVELQEWHLRMYLSEGIPVDLPLGLEAWNTPDEIRAAVRNIAGESSPYDWEAEGDL